VLAVQVLLVQVRVIERVSALCVLRAHSSPARRTLVDQAPGALATMVEDDALSERANRASQVRRPVQVRVREALPRPLRAELSESVQVCPRAQTARLEEVGMHRVEEEPVAWAPGCARALVVRSLYQGQLKRRCRSVGRGQQLNGIVGSPRRKIARVHLSRALPALLVFSRSTLGVGNFALTLSG
jgi:hypothetical protein